MEWINESKKLYWRNIKYASYTNKQQQLNPFKVNLQNLKPAEETDCPKCGQDSDTSFITLHHFITIESQGSEPLDILS